MRTRHSHAHISIKLVWPYKKHYFPCIDPLWKRQEAFRCNKKPHSLVFGLLNKRKISPFLLPLVFSHSFFGFFFGSENAMTSLQDLKNQLKFVYRQKHAFWKYPKFQNIHKFSRWPPCPPMRKRVNFWFYPYTFFYECIDSNKKTCLFHLISILNRFLVYQTRAWFLNDNAFFLLSAIIIIGYMHGSNEQ